MRRDHIEDVIKAIQEQMEAAGVQRVTELPPEEREKLVTSLRDLLEKPK